MSCYTMEDKERSPGNRKLPRERKTCCNFLKPQTCSISLLLEESDAYFSFFSEKRHAKIKRMDVSGC